MKDFEGVKIMRDLVKLVCTECGSENYHTTKNNLPTQNKAATVHRALVLADLTHNISSSIG